MSVLVVGAGGFIGRHMVNRLGSTATGDSLGCVLWRQSEHGSILEPSQTDVVLAAIRPSAVINLAWAPTRHAQYEYDLANQIWATKSLEFALSVTRHCDHYITFGSAAELIPTVDTPYARAKRQLLKDMKESMPPGSWSWLRPQWVYSWNDRRPRLLAAARAAMESGYEFLPRTAGALHDFIEVTDVTDAAMLALNCKLTGELDIATGVEISVDTFLRSLGISRTSGSGDESGNTQPSRTQPSVDLLAHGWRPVTTRRQLNLHLYP